MLVIRRRAGESILIGAEVEVQIIEITPTRVKLGITAAEHIPVLRKETKLTREQNLAAAQASPAALAALLRHFQLPAPAGRQKTDSTGSEAAPGNKA